MKKLRLIVLVVLFAVVTRSCEFFPALHSPEEFLASYLPTGTFQIKIVNIPESELTSAMSGFAAMGMGKSKSLALDGTNALAFVNSAFFDIDQNINIAGDNSSFSSYLRDAKNPNELFYSVSGFYDIGAIINGATIGIREIYLEINQENTIEYNSLKVLIAPPDPYTPPPDPYIPPTPQIDDENHSARILVTNLIKDRSVTSITTTKTTKPDPILGIGEKILPRHEKTAWVDYEDELNFTFDFESLDGVTTETATLRKPLQLFNRDFSYIYLYRNSNGDIVISPTPIPVPDDREPGTPTPMGYDAWLKIHNLTKLVLINSVTFNVTDILPTSIGVIQPGSEDIAHTHSGAITMTLSHSDPAVTLVRTDILLSNAVTNFYFYKHRDGTFRLEEEKPKDEWLFNEDPDVPPPPSGPGTEEGSSPGTIDDSNRAFMGQVIARNLSKTVSVNKIVFTLSPKVFNMEPGPIPMSEKSILLRPGTWAITAQYTDPVTGTVKTTTLVNKQVRTYSAAPGGPQYIYFYKNTEGNYVISPWDSEPTDKNITDSVDDTEVAREGYGKLYVRNGSSTAIITAVEHLEGSTWVPLTLPNGVIYQNLSTAPEAIDIQKGLQTFRFRIASKPNVFSSTVSRTIPQYNPANSSSIAEIVYIDQMSQNVVVDGMGTLTIVNNTKETTITNVHAWAPGQTSPEFNVTPDPSMMINPKARDSLMLSSGGVGSSMTYIVELFIGAMEHVDKIVKIDSRGVVQIQLDEKDIEDITTGTGGGGSSPGSLKVYNSYTEKYSGVQAPFKIFKFYLETTSGGSTSYIKNLVSPDYEPMPIGNNNVITGITPGFYKLKIVAGFYPWEDYNQSPNTRVAGTDLNVNLITYDCGEIYISGGQEKQYHFDVKGRDVPSGFVTIKNISYTGYDSGTAEYHPMAWIEIVSIPPSDFPMYDTKGHAEGNNPTYKTYTYAGFVSTPTFIRWPGEIVTDISKAGLGNRYVSGWSGMQDGPYALPDSTVLKITQVIGPGQSIGPFLIPPGLYYVRYGDSFGSGRANGNGTSNWRQMDVRSGHRIISLSVDPSFGVVWTDTN
jgi:hypothetical protein